MAHNVVYPNLIHLYILLDTFQLPHTSFYSCPILTLSTHPKTLPTTHPTRPRYPHANLPKSRTPDWKSVASGGCSKIFISVGLLDYSFNSSASRHLREIFMTSVDTHEHENMHSIYF